MIYKLTAWSYSSLTLFEQCPRKYEELRLKKSIKEAETPAIIYGKEIHRAAELHIRDEIPVPAKYAIINPYMEKMKALPGNKLCEHKLGLRIENGKIVPCGFFDRDVWFRCVIDLLSLDNNRELAFVIDYKGLALYTELPTPTGFTTMGAVQVGDTLFSESGKPCRVIGKSEVKQLKCYRITFDDKTSVVCDEEHLWKLHTGEVVGVTELMGEHNGWQRTYVPKIRVSNPIELPDVILPIDPYVLGMWVADGKHTSGEISKPDVFIWGEIQRRGYEVDMTTGGAKKCPTRTVKGLRGKLNELKLLNNKHIPEMYLRAGYNQRLDLLRGLMDGDGSANLTRKQAIYSTVDTKLADQVCELLSSLGQRPKKNTVLAEGFGKELIAYQISFRPLGINPFLLPRKASRVLESWGPGQSWYRTVISVEEIPSVPTQCIMVDSEDHTFLCTRHMIPTHNTGTSSQYADDLQLKLMASAVFLHFGHIKKIKAGLLFFVAEDFIKREYETKQKLTVFSELSTLLQRREEAYNTGVFNPKQNFTCKAYCPVMSCRHNGRRG